MAHKAIVAWVALTCSLAFGENDRVGFGRNCSVYEKPDITTEVKCTGSTGERVSRYEDAGRGFYKIQLRQCVGYVTNACLSFESRRWDSRRPAMVARGGGNGFRLGLTLDGMGLFGRVDGQSSGGYGVGAGLMASVPLGSRFRLAVVPQYRFMQLGIAVDGSGVLDDSPGEFTHRVPHAGVGLMASFLATVPRGLRQPGFWFDLGAEYFWALSARQVDGNGTVVPFEPQDRPLFVFIGTSADFYLSDQFRLIAYLQAHYNLGARGASRILAGRIMVNFSLAL